MVGLQLKPETTKPERNIQMNLTGSRRLRNKGGHGFWTLEEEREEERGEGREGERERERDRERARETERERARERDDVLAEEPHPGLRV